MVIWHFFRKCRGVLVAMIHPFCATRAGKTQSTWSLFLGIFCCKRLCDVVFSHDSPVSERCALAGHRVPDHWHTTRHVWWTHLRNGESACLQSWWRRPRHYSTGDFFFPFFFWGGGSVFLHGPGLEEEPFCLLVLHCWQSAVIFFFLVKLVMWCSMILLFGWVVVCCIVTFTL